MGFGNRPVSGRRVTLTRSPTTSSFNAFASDSNIAIAPPERIFSKTRRHFGIMISARKTSYFRTIPLRSHINSFQIQFLPHPRHWQFRGIVRERLQDRRRSFLPSLDRLSRPRRHVSGSLNLAQRHTQVNTFELGAEQSSSRPVQAENRESELSYRSYPPTGKKA